MKKIRYKLMKRCVIVFMCLTAVFSTALISISFKRSYMAQNAHAFDALSACLKGVQSAHAAYVLKGSDADEKKLNEIARQYDTTARIVKSEKAQSAVSYVSDGVMTAQTDLTLGNQLYRLSIEKSLSDLYAMRGMLTGIYKAAYLSFLPLTAAIMLLSGRSISKPIEKLTQTAKAHAEGNRAARSDVRTNDEIETLSHAFNAMADKVDDEIMRREELIGDLTHEMKTPIQAIMGETDLMLLGKHDEEARFRALETVYHQAQRLDRLSKRMMDWIYLSEGEQANICVCALDRIFENTKNLFAQKAAIIIEEKGFLALADGMLLETLLSNLIDNAINAEAKTIVLTSEKQSGQIVISVTDDGCGMDEETLLHAEEPFYRADKARSRAHGGAGLGLSLSSRIARLHKTKLTYESEKGRGTRVSMSLKEAQND
ncbi:MAG: HAMP domain-containing protein [Clostridia bacterium]|nr:HAMP domain-containing protein [Clostridia bacterium]MBQ5771780.1 HAMP domain-containing protein [Clostridia bacterium]